MKPIIFGLAQVNFTVGALRPNAEKIARVASELREAGADVAVFPELCLCGYPPEDLVLKPHFLDDTEERLAWLAETLPPELVVVLGAPYRKRGRIYNAAFVFSGGAVAAVYRKALLPNYGVFDEKRLFHPGREAVVLSLRGFRIGLQVCEDSWQPSGPPCRRLAEARVDAVINISASPYHRGKAMQRQAILAEAARTLQAPLLYCNLVGGQDELVFDGASLVLNSEGELRARAASFAEETLWAALTPARRRLVSAVRRSVVETVLSAARPAAKARSRPARISPALDAVEEVYEALKLGLRDYMDKNGFQKAVIAVSGGIDSALVATLAVDTLGRKRVVCVTMPSRFSSSETRTDAERLARRLRVPLLTAPIQPLFEAVLAELSPHGVAQKPGITSENLQARIRGLLIMAFSNQFGWLVLSTGNKSELATGYCTLYGDMVGGFALIKDVPKTLVYDLCRWRNRQGRRPVIPRSTIERPPTAELREDQRDADSLPPYEILDPILARYVEQDQRFDAIVAEGFDPDTVSQVIRLVDMAEYKRRQGAPGVKITPRAFGRDRRMPITHFYQDEFRGKETKP